MKEILLEYAKRGAMTKEELAKVLNLSPDQVRRMARDGRLPRIPHMRFVRFDPLEILRVFCEPPTPPKASSLTTERRKISGNRNGGFHKCL